MLAAAQTALSGAAEPARVVFQNGNSIPMTSLTLQGDKLVVQTETDGFKTGQTFPLQSADHVYGEKPAAVNQAVALLLTGKPKDAQKLLEPVVAEHRITAKIPGNFWLEAARALLVAHAANGDAKECTEIGKEISEATPAQGTDPFVTLGKALLLPATVKLAERETALRDLTTDNFPADVCCLRVAISAATSSRRKNATPRRWKPTSRCPASFPPAAWFSMPPPKSRRRTSSPPKDGVRKPRPCSIPPSAMRPTLFWWKKPRSVLKVSNNLPNLCNHTSPRPTP